MGVAGGLGLLTALDYLADEGQLGPGISLVILLIIFCVFVVKGYASEGEGARSTPPPKREHKATADPDLLLKKAPQHSNSRDTETAA